MIEEPVFLTPDTEPDQPAVPAGYFTDRHAVELTRGEIDLAIFGLAHALGWVDYMAEVAGLGEDQTYGIKDRATAEATMVHLLDISESLR